MGQLHLQFSFAALGPLSENVQNQGGTVYHLNADNLLQVLGLGTGELVVKNDHIRFQGLGVQLQLLRLSTSNKRGCIRLGPFLEKASYYLGPGAFSQGCQFIQGFFCIDAYQHRPLRLFAFIGIGACEHALFRQKDFLHPGFLRQLFEGIDFRFLNARNAVHLFR